MKRQFFLICLMGLVISTQLFAQPHNYFTGKVINSVTKEALPFASVWLKKNKLGVTTNADGSFKISNNTSFRTDSLICTFIGFKRTAVAFNNLEGGKTNNIYLKPGNIKLKDVDIVASAKNMDAKAIIRKAIKNITENYHEKPFNYISYYRDYQKKDKIYFNLNEAIVQTLDTGIHVSSTENKFRLLDFKENMDFKRMELSPYYDSLVFNNDNANKFIKYGMLPDQGGNELFILMIHDPIRNFQSQTFSFVNTLAKNFILNHKFSDPVPVYNNNLMLHKISFMAKPYLTGDSLVVSGDIYIQPITYSIHKLNYSGYYLLKGNERKKMFDVDIEYGQADSNNPKMELKYISFNNIFNVIDKADTTYFRVVKTDIIKNETNTKLNLEFNHSPNIELATNKDNYEIQLNDKPVKAKDLKIQVIRKYIYITINNNNNNLSARVTIVLRNIKDINGNILNWKKRFEFHQYRELFVQEFNKNIAFNENCYMQNVPMIQNCISKYVGDQKYWMNTPNSDTIKGILPRESIDQVMESEIEDQNSSVPEKKVQGLLVQKVYETLSNSAHSDSLIEKHLSTFQKSTGNDRVFVHLDRNIYKPGDTIYFQAYIRDQFSGSFESKSSSMYALLFNANKMMVDSTRFKIFNSTASGWMAIPEKAEPGKYHFAAFTGPMQNYDPANAFQLDILVTEQSNPGKIEITFNKEKYNPGDTLVASVRITDPLGNAIGKQKFKGSLSSDTIFIESDETQTNKFGQSQIRLTLPDSIKSQPRFQITTKQETNEVQLTKEVSIPYDDPYFELRFLPEGGTFIEGIRQKVGFNATNFKGQPEQIEGLLKDSSGTILDSIKSGNYGPGYFSCTPKSGLYVELTKGSGTEKIWPLPVPATNGISLSVNPMGNKSFAVEIRSDSYSSNQVTVSCIMNSTQVFLKTLMLDKQKRIVFGTEEFPSGVAQVTLFDKDLKPLAQRLIYVNADKRLNFCIKTDSVYKPEGETELTISVTDDQGEPVEGFFSIAVTDSLRGIDSELFAPGIEYAFNYHPHLASNLPSKVLVKGLENLTDEERDLLFMVYGWSKINWDFGPKKANDQQLANYDLLSMKVLYAWKNHRADRKLDLISLEGPSIKHLTTDDKGEIALPLDSLPEITRSVTLMPVVKDKSSARGAMLSIPYNEQYFKSNKLFIPQPTIPSDEYIIQLPDKYLPMDEKTIELKEFTIKGHQREKRVFHDKYEEDYQYARVRSLDFEILWSSSSLETAIRRLVTPLRVTNESIILRSSLSFFGGEIPALIVLDGMPLMTGGWSMVSSISPNELTSLTILIKGKGVTRYGSAAQGGVIFINTRSSNLNLEKIRSNWIAQNSKDKMLVPIDLYRPILEFYNPTKQGDDIDPIIQNRATIFWNPEVYFDGKEPVKINYTNLKRRGPVSITINGVSSTDLMGTGKARYLVQ